MISFLKGVIAETGEKSLVLDVHGVGYEVIVPFGVLKNLPPLGEEVKLHTHLYLREDFAQLYGFLSREDRDLFRLLLTVQGIGPRVALTILDVFSGEELLRVVSQENIEGLLQVPGIGKKSAQRLLLELREKLPRHFGEGVVGSGFSDRSVYDEAFDALLALGYSKQEAGGVLKKIEKNKKLRTASEVLRCALKELGKGKE
ncbi:MAG: Holliday junction ATP-dependent DNA helicase RuvA [Thermoanaerobacterales bacterium 50_218]|nr:MAG: Holliday junction ATP-dependent DNA helicase RuvA [Thermoanaerobacterales bacterium 50_218]